jgi:hypothetical protein
LSVIGAGNFRFSGRSAIYSTADGNLTLFNNFSTGFNLLTLGGITSAFPAIKRNGTGIDIRLADDSAFAPLGVGRLDVAAGGQINLGSTSSKLYVSSGAGLRSSGAGIWLMFNDAENDFNRLQLGGTTSAFPAIKRNGTEIDIKLADDSAFAPISSLYQRFGSNTPEGAVTAPIGAVYHRTDSGAHPKFYVKESGAAANGWVGK